MEPKYAIGERLVLITLSKPRFVYVVGINKHEHVDGYYYTYRTQNYRASSNNGIIYLNKDTPCDYTEDKLMRDRDWALMCIQDYEKAIAFIKNLYNEGQKNKGYQL